MLCRHREPTCMNLGRGLSMVVLDASGIIHDSNKIATEGPIGGIIYMHLCVCVCVFYNYTKHYCTVPTLYATCTLYSTHTVWHKLDI